MEFISKNWTSLFQGLGFRGPLICLDLDPDVKPIRAPNHCEPISKLDAIKAAPDAYETTGQPTESENKPPPNRENTELLRPLSASQ